MRAHSGSLLAALGSLLLGAGEALAAPILYHVDNVTITELGSLGYGAFAMDINNNGDIVGYYMSSGGAQRAFRWRNGVLTDLGSPAGSSQATAWGINDVGEVVGYYNDPSISQQKPFYWSEGTGFIEMSKSLYPGQRFDSSYVGRAFAINNAGLIVGTVQAGSANAPVPHSPCYWSVPVGWENAFDAPEILSCPNNSYQPNEAMDINNAGTIIVNESDANGVPKYSYVWKAGVIDVIPNPFAGNNVWVYGINNSGVAVGRAIVAGNYRAILWDGVSLASQWLGVLTGGASSSAYEVNDQNFVVGISQKLITNLPSLNTATKNRAYIWHKDFGMFALPIPADMAPLTTACEGVSLNNRVSATGVIQVVGSCGTRALRWNVFVNRY